MISRRREGEGGKEKEGRRKIERERIKWRRQRENIKSIQSPEGILYEDFLWQKLYS